MLTNEAEVKTMVRSVLERGGNYIMLCVQLALRRTLFKYKIHQDQEAVRPSVRLHQRVLLNSSEAGSGRFFGSPNTGNRPAWFTDNGLKNQGFAPTDDTYKYLKAFRKAHPNWYVRGHLCMKLHAARISPEAEWNTHTMLNAVPPPGVQCRYLAGSRVQDGRLG